MDKKDIFCTHFYVKKNRIIVLKRNHYVSFLGSGSIEREELKTILTTCMEESSLFLGEDHLNDLTDVMFDAAGKDRTGSMTFDDLRQVVEKHPSVMENLTLRYII